MLSLYSDEYFMKEALKEAKQAFQKDEVPVGAVIVFNNIVIARAHNLTEALTDVTAHAEMQAFTAAANTLGNKFLQECTLYVTLEPCTMCAGASYWTQIGKIVFGASDPKRGYKNLSPNSIHPKTEILSGIMEKECSDLLKLFFEQKR
ncbi:MAG: tRNA-specific adenosine deaminase [Bacteroidetes bacterium]|nr:tRNA-specific adenosine deaminase [Bacteroidota bacterium]